MRKLFGVMIASALCCVPVFAQQTGSLTGRVTSPEGEDLPGVVVEASSEVLPRARATTTLENGSYTLPQLPPGPYTVAFSLTGMETVTRTTQVSLDQESRLDVTMGLDVVEEQIEVVAETALMDRSSAEIKDSLGQRELELMPIGQEYRELQKLIPGVQYTEDQSRGPSAGGSGQDNTYQFDGVSVNLPLFGTLSAEPSTHDIDQVSIVKGGAQAIDFNRAGGFLMDTVSKSGTNRFRGEASYQIQNSGMIEDQDVDVTKRFDEDRDWATLNLGGPIVKENLFFYGSYYRPTIDRANSANVYGEVPDFNSERDEIFGKLTWTPTSKVFLNGSYRDSDRESEAASIGGFSHPSTSEGDAATLEIGILEGSWIINDRSFASFKASDFANETSSRPDNLLDLNVALDGSVGLNVNDLASQGHFFVPAPLEGEPAFNEFIQPLIDQFGYLENGQRVGGGDVGVGSLINEQDFFRESFQAGYDLLIDGTVSHDVHFGYQWFSDEEELQRTSNGWGDIIVLAPGAQSTDFGQATYRARLFAGQAGAIPVGSVRTEYESQNLEVNDTIRWNNWTFNVGVLVSQDTLYGQGLRRDSSTESGFSEAPGNKYEMHKIDWDDLIQPRLSANWAYNGRDTAYASYARYNPAASSLPRAAAWDRNFFLRTVDAFFDADGNLLGVGQVSGSSGKLFQEGLDPRYVDEYMIGTSRQLTDAWTGRAYARHRYATNFWEDTNNNARVSPAYDPPASIPNELYIPTNDLVGTGSYVIGQMDEAFTKFYEATFDVERRAARSSFRGSYTWSHYYGNFDQDNTTTFNDQPIFIGSSFIADAPGRQTWDNRYGNLRGDRRHLLKLYGTYDLQWNASVGAFGVYQSGQPWEAWNVEAYRCRSFAPDGTCLVPGTGSSSSTSRFAEPAGSRESDDHYQIDLNYTQNFPFGDRYNVQLALDVFNVTDNQTGYNINPFETSPTFGEPRSFYAPRRLQAAVRFQF